MAINIEIEKNSNESSASVLRRFQKKVQGSGVLPRVRSIRYAKRQLSHYKTKVQRLNSINKKSEIEELIRMGKMADRNDASSRPRTKK